MHDATGQYYDTHAEQLAARYRGADVTALHILLRRWLTASGSVLEIGCGIGRESAFMSALGLDVLATDARVTLKTCPLVTRLLPNYMIPPNATNIG